MKNKLKDKFINELDKKYPIDDESIRLYLSSFSGIGKENISQSAISHEKAKRYCLRTDLVLENCEEIAKKIDNYISIGLSKNSPN